MQILDGVQTRYICNGLDKKRRFTSREYSCVKNAPSCASELESKQISKNTHQSFQNIAWEIGLLLDITIDIQIDRLAIK